MMVDDSKEQNSHDFKLERLKFVLQQIDRLNDRFHKYVVLFQSLATAIIVAAAAVFVFWTQAGIAADATKTLIRGLLGALFLLAMFIVTSIVLGVLSWMDYRREESRLLNEEVGAGYRELPVWGNIWRWHETYLVVFILSSVCAVIAFTEWQILPLIR